MTTFNANNSSMLWIGDYTDASDQRRMIARNNEVWLRVYGDVLTVDYRQTATGDPLAISIDGGAFTALTSVTTNTGGSEATSSNLISGASDDWHDVVLRISNAFRENFYFAITGGITVTSTGGTADLAAHSEYGEFQTIRGTHATSYWRDTYSTTNYSLASGYASPIFPAAQPSGAFAQHYERYVEFKVDTNTTKIRPVIGFDGSRWLSVWVDGRLIYQYRNNTAISSFVGSLEASIAIPGSGERTVRICNAKALYGVVTDGAFPTSAVASSLPKVLGFGDSATAGGSVTYESHAATWHLLSSVSRGDFDYYNAGYAGDTAAAATTNGRVTKDVVPWNPDFVIFNFGINDSARWLSDTATVETEYQTLIQAILDNTSAHVIVVAPVDPTTANRSTIVTGLQSVVTTMASSRVEYYSSDTWTVDDLREGAHPNTLGYGLACGYGVVELLGQPSDADTVTVDSTVYEFDSGGGVSGGNVAVTIGADVTATVQNLSTAIRGQGQTVLAERVVASGTINKGLILTGLTSLAASGTNIDPYYDGDGWDDVYEYLFGSTNYNCDPDDQQLQAQCSQPSLGVLWATDVDDQQVQPQGSQPALGVHWVLDVDDVHLQCQASEPAATVVWNCNADDQQVQIQCSQPNVTIPGSGASRSARKLFLAGGLFLGS